MAITIVSRGIDPKTITLKGTCSNCKTTVECEQSDAKYSSGGWAGDSSYTVECPVCDGVIHTTKNYKL